jgi:hypothetical protein
MRIGCLQFDPVVGDLDNNISRAEEILLVANPKDLDLLVLPELAFTGEPIAVAGSGIWRMMEVAMSLNCIHMFNLTIIPPSPALRRIPYLEAILRFANQIN